VIRHSKIKSIETKKGRSGELVFISIEHTYWLEGVAALCEQQDLVFRESAKPGFRETPSDTEAETRDCIACKEIEPSSVLLFRYSALTFNSHRIHYDRDYAVDSEGYEGLVVQGPLLATQLIEFAQQYNDNKQRLAGFTFRAMRPVSDKHRYKLCIGEREDSSLPLWIENHEGAVAMKASAVFENS
jgi:3-methylfumaryl-CoA hydratase